MLGRLGCAVAVIAITGCSPRAPQVSPAMTLNVTIKPIIHSLSSRQETGHKSLIGIVPLVPGCFAANQTRCAQLVTDVAWKIYLNENKLRNYSLTQSEALLANKLTKRMEDAGDHPYRDLMKDIADFLHDREIGDVLSIGLGWWGEALSELRPTIMSAPPPEQPEDANAYVESLTDTTPIDQELAGVAVGLDTLTSDPSLYTPERAAAIKSLQSYRTLLQNRRARVVYYGPTGTNPTPSTSTQPQPASPQPPGGHTAGAPPGSGPTPAHTGPDHIPNAPSEEPVQAPEPVEAPAQPETPSSEAPKPPLPPPPPTPAPPAPPAQGPVPVHIGGDTHEGGGGASVGGGSLAGGPGDNGGGGGGNGGNQAAFYRLKIQPPLGKSPATTNKTGCVAVSNPTAGTWTVCFKDQSGKPLIVMPSVDKP